MLRTASLIASKVRAHPIVVDLLHDRLVSKLSHELLRLPSLNLRLLNK